MTAIKDFMTTTTERSQLRILKELVNCIETTDSRLTIGTSLLKH